MLRFILRRLGAGVVLLFAVSTLAFFMLLAGAGNVGRGVLGVNATNDDVARWNREHHLSDSAISQ